MRTFVLVVTALAVLAASGASATASVTFVRLPAGPTFTNVERSGHSLLVSGTAPTGDGCVWMSADARTLRLNGVSRASCSRPTRAAHRFEPVLVRDPRSFMVRVRVARVEPGHTRLLGPVVMRFRESSDTHLEWTYGPGALWLFDTASTDGPEVIEVSMTTGRAVRSVHMPRNFRPLLAADADGLWLAMSTSGGFSGGGAAPLYRVAPTSGGPAIVRRGGRAALWLAANGHTVWVDVVSGRTRQQILRLDGVQGRARSLGRPAGLHSGAAALDPATQTLWLASDVPASGSFDACPAERVVRLDGRTGTIARVADIALPAGRCLYAEPGSTLFAFGAFYVLDDQARPNRLYRVAP
ncbi:MAG TPA: hypothetical protein VFK76_09560 [Gaiellaceae bacterium]|nr:hypothetical protein [Gaiellaceae bacterium]